MALNTPYKRIDPNRQFDYAAMGQKDPWFALGYALGEGYWKNYNARGEQKATETAAEFLKNYKPEPQEVPKDLVNQAMTISVGGNTVGEKEAKKASSGDGKGTIKPEVDHGLLKWSYLEDKYKDNPNPVGDSIAVKDIAANTAITLNNANMGTLDWSQFESALRQQLTLDKRNAQQQDAAIAAIKPMFEARKGEYNKQQAKGLFEAATAAFANGDNKSGESYALQLSKYDKDTARYLLNKENARYKSELDYNRQMAIANAKHGGNSGGVDVFNTPKFKFIVKERDRLQKKIDEGVGLNKAEIEDYNKYNDIIYDAVNGNSVSSEQEISLDNPATMIAIGNKFLNDKKGDKADVRKYLSDKLASKEISQSTFDEAIKEFAEKIPLLKARRHNEDEGNNTFMGRDATKRSEWLEWLGSLEAKDIAPLAKKYSK